MRALRFLLLMWVCGLVPLSAMASATSSALPPATSEDGPSAASSILATEAHSTKEFAPGSRKPVLYPRAHALWTFATGPDYGSVPSSLADSPDVIVTRVGAFDATGPGLPLPAALRALERPAGPAYFLVQFRPEAFVPEKRAVSLQELARSGAEILDYVPHNAYLVRATRSSLASLRSLSLLQFVGPYHPAFKIAPDLGTAPLPDPVKAASPVYSLLVKGFPHVTSSELSAEIAALGGTVTYAEDSGDGPTILADLDGDRIVPLARIDEVRTIDENLPRFAMGEEIGWNVITGTYVPGRRPPLYLAGVNGNGRYLNDVDNPPISTSSPVIAGPEDVDWNGNGVIDNAAQIIGLTDTGMSVAAGDFSETATVNGWNGNGGLSGPNVPRFGDGLTNRNHRKIAWYERAPGSSGDTASCCSPASHGTIMAEVAAGNASSGPFAGDALDWTGDGTPDDYGDPNPSDPCGPGFCIPSGGINYRIDGVAPGARLVFQDVASTCPEPESFFPGSFGTLLGDARGKGARVHAFPFGAFNFGLGTQYDSGAVAIDNFLASDADRDFMLFVSAGNNGSASTSTGGYAKARTVTNEGASKNPVVVGGNSSGSSASLQSRPFYSSVGPAPNGTACPAQTPNRPAPSNCGRIKPDVMAPSQDGGGIGLAEVYGCGCGQTGPVSCSGSSGGGVGTSFSAAAVAGSGALIRDYFVQGFFPDGSSSNVGNDADRWSQVSGALVKALLIASADHMSGSGLNPGYGHRLNPETGYGAVDLRNVLPLTIDPRGPSDLLVHDAGCPTGEACPSNLPLPMSLGPNMSGSLDFDLSDTRGDLRVVLAWIERADGLGAGTLVNDLDLELRYCGSDGNCATPGGTCIGGPTPGLACTTDAMCSPSQSGACDMDRIWYGNVFTEDPNDDGTEDQDLDGTPGVSSPGPGHWRSEGAWSLANRDADADGTDDDGPGNGDVIAARDNRNNVEAIYLSPDPEGDGTDAPHDGDRQVRAGRWRLTVSHNATGPDFQKYAVVLVAGRTDGILAASFDKIDKNRFEWMSVDLGARYDVATRQGIPVATVSAAAWLGAGGYFDTFSCRQDDLACFDGDGDGRCEYVTALDGAPSAGTLDLWLVRLNGGSWDEAGSTGLSVPPVARDTRMIDDGSPVCP